MDQHLRHLDECFALHESLGKSSGRAGTSADPFERLCLLNPDLMLEIAKVTRASLEMTLIVLFGQNAMSGRQGAHKTEASLSIS